MRIKSSWLRSAALCGVATAVWLVGIRPAAAEVTLIEKDGWSFFTDGRVNAFFSQGIGDDFPQPSPNPNVTASGRGPDHSVVGAGNPFTAGYYSLQGDAAGKYNAARVRNGFLASVLTFGMIRQLSETTFVKGYISLWGTTQTYARDRTQDVGGSVSKGFDVREGAVDIEGPWGAVVVGRQGGLFGHTSTEIDYLYAHNYGLGLPCLDDFYASCGHIGTGALGPGYAAGIVYATPSIGGVKLQVGLYDPVRLLGVWERVPYPRPEAILSYERRTSPGLMFKLSVEGMYQYMGQLGGTEHTTVWGVAGGGRVEAGPLRLGLSAFRGQGLGAYVALQNSASSFNSLTRQLRSFTGYYAQTALVVRRWQISAGAGRVVDDQLESDKLDLLTSNLKSQTGLSLGAYYALTEHLVVGADGFRFQTDWWGAPNSALDANGQVVAIPGVIAPEKQVIYFINVGATFHW